MRITIESCLASAPSEDLQEIAAHWLSTAMEQIPLDESPEEIATAIWSVVGGSYRRIPRWMQRAACAAWRDRNPGPFEGRSRKGGIAHMRKLDAWFEGWLAFVEGRHDT